MATTLTTAAAAMNKMVTEFKAARRVSTPLLAISCPDPAATMDALAAQLRTEKQKPAILVWDICRGLRADESEVSKRALRDVCSGAKMQTGEEAADPTAALRAIDFAPDGTCVFFVNLHLFLKDPVIVQAIWNLRDSFKVNRRTFVMLAPAVRMPPELERDVIVLDEPLPTPAELQAIIIDQIANVNEGNPKPVPVPDAATMSRAVDAVTGLSAFTVEQIVAMSIKTTGIDLDALWEFKKRAIEMTAGLGVWREGNSFASIAGYDNVKTALGRVKGSKLEPHAVIFVDEIEKMMAGVGSGDGSRGDTTGVSQDQLGQILTYMQDKKSNGMIFIGPPGSSKSMFAQATGNELGIPTITLDLGGMKGSLLGQSEHSIRAALKVITSVGQDRVMWIATSNNIASLPPELRRRFKRGTFFFDLPTATERKAIWALYEAKYALSKEQCAARPDDTDWTGAEIAQCAEMAWDYGITLKEASEYVVPVAQSAPEQIRRLRQAASGRFISASYPGVYHFDEKSTAHEEPPAVPARRGMRAITARDIES